MQGEATRVAATAVVIDSHPLRLQRYKPLLAQCQIDVVAGSPTLERAAELADVYACDLLLVDAGADAESRSLYRVLRRAHKCRPELVSIALVDEDDPAIVEAALAAGAFATVDRLASLRRVARLAGEALSVHRAEAAGEAACQARRTRLTRREIEILRLVAEGRSNREVGQLLWVTDQTVKFHLANTYRKLGVRNRFEASQWAVGRGLVREAPVAIDGRQRLRAASVRGLRQTSAGAVAVTP